LIIVFAFYQKKPNNAKLLLCLKSAILLKAETPITASGFLFSFFMQVYKTKSRKLSGTNWSQVSKQGQTLYKELRKKTKRHPYVRSAYFNKQKIFLDLFWQHLHEKNNLRDKIRRLKYLPCAIDLIQQNRLDPISKENPNRRGEIVHRFTGLTPDNEIFFVQIKERKSTNEKWFISVFPDK
jgi:hypothetical protein